MECGRENLSKEELEDLTCTPPTEVHHYLATTGRHNFKVGDWAIKRINLTFRNGYIQQSPHLGDEHNVPKKYKVVYVDSLGVPYCRGILVNGKYSKVLSCMVTDRFHSFEPDQEYLEWSLLSDEEYNPLVRYLRIKNETK